MEFHLPWCTTQLRYTERVARQVLKRLTDVGVLGTLEAIQTVAYDELVKCLLFKLQTEGRGAEGIAIAEPWRG